MKAYFSFSLLKDRTVIPPPSLHGNLNKFSGKCAHRILLLLFNTIKNIEFIISIYLQEMSCLDPFL